MTHTKVQCGSSASSDPLPAFLFIQFSCSRLKIHRQLSISFFFFMSTNGSLEQIDQMQEGIWKFVLQSVRRTYNWKVSSSSLVSV